MTAKKDVLIIIPAYNEEQNIQSVLDQLSTPDIQAISDILVINDASSDGTNRVVQRKGVTMISNIFNLGYGSAIQMGYKYAIRRKYKYVIQMDADGQHDTCNIQKLYEKLTTPDENGQYPDIVLGSRFMEGSSFFPVSGAKKFAFALFRLMIKFFTGRKISDPTTGLQGLSNRAVLYYSKFGRFDDKYPDANMIVLMLLIGYNLTEIPAVMHARTSGESMHSGLKPIVYMVRMFMSILGVVFRIKVLQKKAGEKRDVIFY